MPTGNYGAAGQLAAREYGGQLSEQEHNHTVGVAVAELESGDPERVLTLLVNLSAADVYIGFTPAVSASNGIWLPPNGGSINLNAKDDGVLVTRQIYALASAANSTVYALHMRRVNRIVVEGT